MRIQHYRTWIPGLCLAFAASPASANMGIPTIFLTLPAMLIALVPVVAIEAWIIIKRLGVSAGEASLTSTVANLTSTLLGLPVTWFVLLILSCFARPLIRPDLKRLQGRFLTAALEAPLFPPYQQGYKNWMVLAGCLILMVPYFAASYLVENQVAMFILNDANATGVSLSILEGNIITYGMLVAMLAFATLWSFIRSEYPFLYQRIHATASKGRRWLSDHSFDRPGYFWLSAGAALLLLRTLVQTGRTRLAEHLPKRAGRQVMEQENGMTADRPHLDVPAPDSERSKKPSLKEDVDRSSPTLAASATPSKEPRKAPDRRAA